MDLMLIFTLCVLIAHSKYNSQITALILCSRLIYKSSLLSRKAPVIYTALCPSCTLWKGYECTRIRMATLLSGLKGLRRHTAGVALKRKIAFPRFNTMKVWNTERNTEKKLQISFFPWNLSLHLNVTLTFHLKILQHVGDLKKKN